MKAAHKAHVAKASKIRTQIADKVAQASKVSGDLAGLNEDIAKLRSEMSEIETEAADDGLSTSDLHEACDDLRSAKK